MQEDELHYFDSEAEARRRRDSHYLGRGVKLADLLYAWRCGGGEGSGEPKPTCDSEPLPIRRSKKRPGKWYIAYPL